MVVLILFLMCQCKHSFYILHFAPLALDDYFLFAITNWDQV